MAGPTEGGRLVRENTPGGRGAEPTYDSRTISIMETTVKDARVFSGTLAVRVYDPKNPAKILGGEQYIKGANGEYSWEKGYWIPWIFPLLVTLAFTGPVKAGQRVMILHPKGNPGAGVAIPCQGRGESQDNQATQLSTRGPTLALANWDGGNSWV